MGTTEWVMLAAAVAAVLMVYLITRRNNGPNPWEGMDDDASDELPSNLPQPKKSQHARKAVEPQVDQDSSDVIVDPSVAGEWADFTPEAKQTAADEPARDIDEINPASLRKEPQIDTGVDTAGDKPEPKQPSEAMLGFVSEPRPAQNVQPRQPIPQRKQASRREPHLDAGDQQSTAAGHKTQASQGDQKIVVLHVVAPQDEQLTGTEIHAALNDCGLKFGDRNVYHRMAELEGENSSVFSVANMLKPGTLRPDEADTLRTKGLVMFMVLPGPVDGNKAFHDMLHTAQGLAERLNAKVLDDKRLPLTRQAAQYQIDEIAELQRRLRLAEA
ncbi:MAG: cell division protein ZipA [Salinisphaeraceae bacterium]|nr:cell division protein ZipA [Salinisphaeraceae bacterium]